MVALCTPAVPIRPLGNGRHRAERCVLAQAVAAAVTCPGVLQLVRTIEGHSGIVNAVAVSPDGRFLYSGIEEVSTSRGAVQQWETSSGVVRASVVRRRRDGALQLVRKFKGHPDYVNAVAVSPDGRFVYSGADDNTVKQWDTSSGAVCAAAWSCDAIGDVVGACSWLRRWQGTQTMSRWWSCRPTVALCIPAAMTTP
jgi:WD40 repeat protein